MRKYFWHGEPVKVTFGYCHVKENVEKPMWWYNYEVLGICEPVIHAIKIDNGVHEWVISNHFGIGVNKLKKGGWPDTTHFSLPIEKFSPDPIGAIRYFDELGFAEHEANRRKWQKERFPDLYEKMETLRRSMIIHKGK